MPVTGYKTRQTSLRPLPLPARRRDAGAGPNDSISIPGAPRAIGGCAGPPTGRLMAVTRRYRQRWGRPGGAGPSTGPALRRPAGAPSPLRFSDPGPRPPCAGIHPHCRSPPRRRGGDHYPGPSDRRRDLRAENPEEAPVARISSLPCGHAARAVRAVRPATRAGAPLEGGTPAAAR